MQVIELGNNGNAWAEYLHQNDLIKQNMNVDSIYDVCESIAVTAQQRRFINNNDFLEDMLYSIGELGYDINC